MQSAHSKGSTVNDDWPPKPTKTATWAMRIIIYAALLLLILIVGFFPIFTTAKINFKIINSSTPGH
jgi:hypothetical protein